MEKLLNLDLLLRGGGIEVEVSEGGFDNSDETVLETPEDDEDEDDEDDDDDDGEVEGTEW